MTPGPTDALRVPVFDAHAHLDAMAQRAGARADAVFVAGVLADARAAGVERVVTVGDTVASSRWCVATASAHAGVYAAVAVHPTEIDAMTDDDYRTLEVLARDPRVVAVGETGLDYHYDHSPRAEQQAALRTFIGIARRTHKPLSLHIRDAHDDALAICRAEGAQNGVVHCFTGTLSEAQRWVAQGFHISFSGAVTFKSAAQIREAAAWVPAEHLLLETDCPFLAPVPLRGKRNEPAYLVHTARLVAEVRGIPYEDLAYIASANTRRLFLTSP
jgi:TatD DNase family protein